jgi:hypothetical protein
MIKGKLEKKARSWKPKKEMKNNQQKCWSGHSPKGSSASAPHRHAKGQASFKTRSKVAGGSNRQAQADSILSIRVESQTCDS